MGLTFIDWFAGVGGFRRGMEMAGHKCIGFCEFDKYAVASYTSMHLITEGQREYLETLDMKKRQKEILKEEYRNGEWYAEDVRTVRADEIPRADCWCFGFPCQDISVAGKQLGFAGHRSSLFFAVTKLIRDTKEEDRPQYLFIENVKNLLSVNRGFDFAKLLVELDEVGYDCSWQLCNSKDYGVPQNRERVLIICSRKNIERGMFRFPSPIFLDKRLRDILEDMVDEKYYLSGEYMERFVESTKNEKYPCGNEYRVVGTTKAETDRMGTNSRHWVYDVNHCVSALDATMYKQPKQILVEESETNGPTDSRGVIKIGKVNSSQDGVVVSTEGLSPAHTAGHGNMPKVVDAFRIRKLTPKECFRLQGWDDESFRKAEFVNSNSQLYKQAGNGVTVNVIEAIARKMV